MISADAYSFLSDLLKKHSGLSLGPGKEYLLESRLPPVATQLGLSDLNALVDSLRRSPTQALIKTVCDAMTTNETLWFRDGKPFAALENDVLPAAAKRAKANGRALRIWCAASSTGQEPYSIAILTAQMEKQLDVKVEILATDYCSMAIQRAKSAVYNQFEVQRGLPINLLIKYFQQVPDGFELVQDIRRRVSFEEINLLNPYPTHWQFDVILCRNVLIYFDVATKKDVIDRMSRHLAPGGALFLGGTESTLGITESVVRVPNQPSGMFCRPQDVPMLAPAASATAA